AGICFFFQAEDGIRDFHVTGVQTCALPIWGVEFALAVRHDEHLRRELAGRDKGIRDVIAQLVRANSEQFDVELPMFAQDTAAVLLSLGIGLGVQRLLDPSIPASLLTDLVRMFLSVTPRTRSGTGSNDPPAATTIGS